MELLTLPEILVEITSVVHAGQLVLAEPSQTAPTRFLDQGVSQDYRLEERSSLLSQLLHM
jgi:hypothetical protein